MQFFVALFDSLDSVAAFTDILNNVLILSSKKRTNKNSFKSGIIFEMWVNKGYNFCTLLYLACVVYLRTVQSSTVQGRSIDEIWLVDNLCYCGRDKICRKQVVLSPEIEVSRFSIRSIVEEFVRSCDKAVLVNLKI